MSPDEVRNINATVSNLRLLKRGIAIATTKTRGMFTDDELMELGRLYNKLNEIILDSNHNPHAPHILFQEESDNA